MVCEVALTRAVLWNTLHCVCCPINSDPVRGVMGEGEDAGCGGEGVRGEGEKVSLWKVAPSVGVRHQPNDVGGA